MAKPARAAELASERFDVPLAGQAVRLLFV
jgi:hypothetical protein